MKKGSYNGKGRLTLCGSLVSESNLNQARREITGGLIRALYGMRDTGLLPDRLNTMLFQWDCSIPIGYRRSMQSEEKKLPATEGEAWKRRSGSSAR